MTLVDGLDVAILRVDDLSKSYAARGASGRTRAIDSISFEVAESEFVSVVGPSGCGKSTLLRCIAGLMPATSGTARLHGRPVTAPVEDMALVFQDYNRSLFPWMTVRRNVEIPLVKRMPADQVATAVSDALASVGLDRFGDHYPWQLSGGMQQRVAIARALAYGPRILLMDEPFASVDAQTRAELEDLVLRIRHATGVTVLLVTHDIDEAIYMSDRVVVLSRQPSSVLHVLDVPLPAQRDQVSTKATPEFQDLRGRVYDAVTRAHQHQHDAA
jgi:NitT/TauT family transport system ATP-binding protein